MACHLHSDSSNCHKTPKHINSSLDKPISSCSDAALFRLPCKNHSEAHASVTTAVALLHGDVATPGEVPVIGSVRRAKHPAHSHPASSLQIAAGPQGFSQRAECHQSTDHLPSRSRLGEREHIGEEGTGARDTFHGTHRKGINCATHSAYGSFFLLAP